mgnify:CR=1 FL=1|jgi:hypothetical protein
MEKTVGDQNFSIFLAQLEQRPSVHRNEPNLRVPDEPLFGERNARRRFRRRVWRHWRACRAWAIKNGGWFPIIIRENGQGDARHHEASGTNRRGAGQQIRRSTHAHEPAHAAATAAAANTKAATFASLQQHRDDQGDRQHQMNDQNYRRHDFLVLKPAIKRRQLRSM